MESLVDIDGQDITACIGLLTTPVYCAMEGDILVTLSHSVGRPHRLVDSSVQQ